MKRLLASIFPLVAGIVACSDASLVLQSQVIASPDSKWAAVVQEVDNGLGFGLGALHREVHVVNGQNQPSGHGDSGKSVVFYINISEYRGPEPSVSVKWLSPTHLRVTYAETLVPSKQLGTLTGVTVEYATKASKT